MKKQKEIIRKNGKVNNLIGRNFGYLEVISKTEKRDHNHVIWECKCVCGELVYKRSSELNDNYKTVSCGCFLENKKYINRTSINQIFGRLKVIEILNDKWAKVECQCGTIFDKKIKTLFTKGNMSCGCLKSEHWLEITKKATEKNIVLDTNIGRIQSKNISKRNTTGVTGVYYNKKNNNWFSNITFQKKVYYLGTFSKKQDAIKKRKTAEKELFGNFIKWYKKNYKSKIKEVI